MRLAALIVTIAALAGCATQPTPSNYAERKAPDRSVGPAAGGGTISVIRDEGVTAVICNAYILIDSVDVGHLDAGERMDIPVAAGERVVTVRTRGLCGGGGYANAAVTVAPGATQHLRIGFGMNGDLRLDAAAPGYR